MTIETATPAAYEALMLRTEFGIRTFDGQDETVRMVADEALMWQELADALEAGTRAEPVYRTVTAWQTDETALARVRREVAREAILATAQRFWEGETTEADALAELRPHAPQMSDHDRAERLGELVSELEHAEDVDNDHVVPGPGQDKQTLIEDAERRVIEAADALYGGAS